MVRPDVAATLGRRSMDQAWTNIIYSGVGGGGYTGETEVKSGSVRDPRKLKDGVDSQRRHAVATWFG